MNPVLPMIIAHKKQQEIESKDTESTFVQNPGLPIQPMDHRGDSTQVLF